MSGLLLGNDILHYEVLGRGRPLIFLHGWVGSWRYWIPAMQAASVSFRAYALDFWGFGDSAKAQRCYSVEQQTALIDRFMEQMGIGRVALVGHGLGAVAALLFCRQHPEWVDRLLLIGLPLEEGMISHRMRASSAADLAGWLLGRTALTEPVLTDAPKTDPAAVQVSLTGLAAAQLPEIWRGLATPCLLVNGQNDPAVEPPRPEHLSALPEQSHAILFEQSGHFPMLDETSKFNRLLADFLTLTSGESPRDLQLKEEWKRRVR